VPAVGFFAASLLWGGANLVAGLLVSGPPVSRRVSRATTAPPMPLYRLLGTAFGCGLLGMGYEWIGLRVLSQALENTFFTFAAALAVYLSGTALGAAIHQRLQRSPQFQVRLAILLCSLAVVCLIEIRVMIVVPRFYDSLRALLGDSVGAVLASECLAAAAVFLVPTLFMGAIFSHLVAATKTPAGGIGRASALNTLGGAFAGMVFGVFVLPATGAKWSIVIIAAGYLLMLPTCRHRIWMGVAGAAVLCCFLPSDLHLMAPVPGSMVRDYRDGLMASVAVIEAGDGHRTLRINNRFQMGGTAAALAERRQAHLPLLLHPHPARALFLGPGTGITLGAASEHPGLRVDGVELNPEVIEMMHHFAPENRGVGSRTEFRNSGTQPESIHLVTADARRYVRASLESYDVIVADLFHPAQDGAAFLYTREHFAAVRDRLAMGGLFCQWLPLHQLDEPTLCIIVRTFLEVFPATEAFLLHFNTDIPALALVGTHDRLSLSLDWMERRASDPAFHQAMKQSGFDRTLALLGCHLAGSKALAEFAGTGPLNTDNFPRVAFAAPRFAVRKEARRDQLLLTLLARFESDPRAFLSGISETESFAARLSDFIAARDLYLRGLSIEADGKLPEAIELYLQAAHRSVYFTAAYARVVNIIQVMAGADANSARVLFERLKTAQPGQPLGEQLLGPLFRDR
jgi:spermidine synthase